MNDAWFLMLVPVFLAAVLTAAMELSARIGGWNRLSLEYRLHDKFEGFRKPFVSGEMLGGPFFGLPCNYGGCLILGSNADGLYVSVILLFRPGHPPLFIPWRDITASAKKGWFSTKVTFHFDRLPPIRLRVAKRLAEELTAEAEKFASKALAPVDC